MWGLSLLVFLKSSSFRRRVVGALRVSMYVMLVGVVGLVLSARRAKAAMDEHSFRLAKELLPIADLLQGATGLRINGERINFSMTIAHDTSPTKVLDRIERNCSEHPGPLARKLRALADQVPSSLPAGKEVKELLNAAALARNEAGGQGAVLCFTSNESADRLASTLEHAGEFTTDLAELGNLRYVVAARGDGSAHEENLTRVISLWTEGSFRLERLIPPAIGDAVGTDSAVLPRPPRSVRLFSAEAQGAPYSVRIYETDLPPNEVLGFYDKKMVGFAAIAPSGQEDKGRGYVKDALPLIVNVSRDESKTIVTLSELGPGGGPAYQGGGATSAHE